MSTVLALIWGYNLALGLDLLCRWIARLWGKHQVRLWYRAHPGERMTDYWASLLSPGLRGMYEPC